LPPSAAIVSAAMQTVRAPSGNFSKSFRAALIHDRATPIFLCCHI
jgi:hypothetical protein